MPRLDGDGSDGQTSGMCASCRVGEGLGTAWRFVDEQRTSKGKTNEWTDCPDGYDSGILEELG